MSLQYNTRGQCLLCTVTLQVTWGEGPDRDGSSLVLLCGVAEVFLGVGHQARLPEQMSYLPVYANLRSEGVLGRHLTPPRIPSIVSRTDR